ncbi:glutathione S-transferase [Paracandidimonas soli]|nr:glutathione S-transferase [Paracandidimonas soli]
MPILYSFRRCPYAMRARLAIFSSGVPCELREVVLRSKPAAMLEASPKGTVPVLVLPGGRVIDESLDIMRWALGCADPEGWLAPQGVPLEEMQRLTAQNDGEFKRRLDRYKYPQRFGLEAGETDRDAAVRWLGQLDRALRESAFLSGGRPVLADMAILPFIRQFAHVDLEWFRQQSWPGLQRWLDWFLDSRIFAGCMEKYAAWQPGSEPVVFPAQQA